MEGIMASLLYHLFDKRWKSRKVPDRCKVVILPLYKRKGSRQAAEDQIILAASARELQEMVTEMNNSVKKKGLKVNVARPKLTLFERGESITECDIYRK
ncbi:hypothetical protein EVAR_28610_1 [Eumeta japonica]|uniref:Uncharacterized protein n=1 Tax=Eumeta variegata TaxID=151549 RepID=A0A4C1XUN0_EUMVA|nr:hypothetical protein EVAR_28610_1 [Eumeta japonica]